MSDPSAGAVLHLVDRDSPPIAARLIAALVSGQPARSRIAALGDGQHIDWLARFGLPFEFVPLRGRAEPLRSLPLGRWLARQLRGSPPAAAIHAHSPRAAGCATVAMLTRPALKAVPVLVEVHSQPEARPVGWLARQSRRRRVHFAVRSAAMARLLADAGVPGRRIAIVPPVVGPDQQPDARLAAPARRAEVRRALGLPDAAGPVLLSAGWCRRREGQKQAFWAAAICSMLAPDLRIVVPGDGPQRDMLIDWMARAGFARMTIFPGRQFDWPDLLAAADVLVFADGHDERGPVEPDIAPAAWAMLLGVPVVAVRSGGIEELISDGRTGLLAPPARPRELAMRIRQALTDAALRRAITEQARAEAAARNVPAAAAYRLPYAEMSSP